MTQRLAPLFAVTAFGLATVASSSTVFAQGLVVPKGETAAAESAAPAPPSDWGNYNARPLTPSKGMLAIHGDLISNLSTNHGGKPVWITPNIYYGITDQLTVGIAENPQAEFTPIGGGFCLASSSYCAKVFNHLYPVVLLSVSRTDSFELVVHGGVDFQLSPSSIWAQGGVLLKAQVATSLAVMADPLVTIAVTNRSPANQEQISVPVRLGWQANGQVNLGFIAGVNGPLVGTPGFNDAFAIPMGINAWLSPNDKLDVGANFTFLNLAGRAGGLDGRTIALSANYRM